MQVKTKVRIDTIIGYPIAIMLNIAAKTLGFLLGINHTFDKKPKRIVVCKLLGMGSIIQATPLLQTLKENNPDAELIFVSSTQNKIILQTFPFIDKLILINDSSFFKILPSTFKAIFKFWSSKPDLYIDLETYSYYSTILSLLSLSQNRIGFYRKESNIRLGIYTHMMFFNAKTPIAQSYLQMARLSGSKTINENLYNFKSLLNRKDIIDKLSKIEGYNSNSKSVIINPNASDLRRERRWGTSNYAELLSKLSEKYTDYNFLIIGSKAEEHYTNEIFNKSNKAKNIINTVGKFSLTDLINIIETADLLITNDTGPMHISFALKKQTLTLFGPTSPLQYGSNKAFIISKEIYCSPCVHEFILSPCNGNNICMQQISVDEVYNLSINILENNSTKSYNNFYTTIILNLSNKLN